MKKVIDTFNYGEVTLRDCFDVDNNLSGESYIEVTDTNNNIIAEIYGYSVGELNNMKQNEIEDLIDEYIL